MKATLIAAALCLALVGCGGGGDDPPPAPTLASVTYSITGTGPVDVTYSIPGGGTSQERAFSGSFSRSFTAKPGDFLYVSGQTNSSASFASVSAKVSVNGSTFKSASSVGPFVIATASGSCC